MRDLTLGLLSAYCIVCALILLAAAPDWILLPMTLAMYAVLFAYIAWDLRRALRWRRVARRISE